MKEEIIKQVLSELKTGGANERSKYTMVGFLYSRSKIEQALEKALKKLNIN